MFIYLHALSLVHAEYKLSGGGNEGGNKGGCNTDGGKGSVISLEMILTHPFVAHKASLCSAIMAYYTHKAALEKAFVFLENVINKVHDGVLVKPSIGFSSCK